MAEDEMDEIALPAVRRHGFDRAESGRQHGQGVGTDVPESALLPSPWGGGVGAVNEAALVAPVTWRKMRWTRSPFPPSAVPASPGPRAAVSMDRAWGPTSQRAPFSLRHGEEA